MAEQALHDALRKGNAVQVQAAAMQCITDAIALLSKKRKSAAGWGSALLYLLEDSPLTSLLASAIYRFGEAFDLASLLTPLPVLVQTSVLTHLLDAVKRWRGGKAKRQEGGEWAESNSGGGEDEDGADVDEAVLTFIHSLVTSITSEPNHAAVVSELITLRVAERQQSGKKGRTGMSREGDKKREEKTEEKGESERERADMAQIEIEEEVESKVGRTWLSKWVAISSKSANVLKMRCPLGALHERFLLHLSHAIPAMLEVVLKRKGAEKGDGSDVEDADQMGEAAAHLFPIVWDKLCAMRVGQDVLLSLLKEALRMRRSAEDTLLPLLSGIDISTLSELVYTLTSSLIHLRAPQRQWEALLGGEREREKLGEEGKKERPAYRSRLLAAVMEKVMRKGDGASKEYAKIVLQRRVNVREAKILFKASSILAEQSSTKESGKALQHTMLEYALSIFGSDRVMKKTALEDWKSVCVYTRLLVSVMGDDVNKYATALFDGVQLHMGHADMRIRQLGIDIAKKYAEVVTPDVDIEFEDGPDREGSDTDGTSLDEEEEEVREGEEEEEEEVKEGDEEKDAERRENSIANALEDAIMDERREGRGVSRGKSESKSESESESDSDSDSLSSFYDLDEFESDEWESGGKHDAGMGGKNDDDGEDFGMFKPTYPRSFAQVVEQLNDSKKTPMDRLACVRCIPKLAVNMDRKRISTTSSSTSLRSTSLTSPSSSVMSASTFNPARTRLWQNTLSVSRHDSTARLAYSVAKMVMKADLTAPDSERAEDARVIALSSLVGKDAFVEGTLVFFGELLRQKDETLLCKAMVLKALREGAQEYTNSSLSQLSTLSGTAQGSGGGGRIESGEVAKGASDKSEIKVGKVKWRSSRLDAKEKASWINQFGAVAAEYFKCVSSALLIDSPAREVLLERDHFLVADMVETLTYFVMLAENTSAVRYLLQESTEIIRALSPHPSLLVRKALVRGAMRVIYVADSAHLIESMSDVKELIQAASKWSAESASQFDDEELHAQLASLERMAASSRSISSQLREGLEQAGSAFGMLKIV